MNTFKKLAVAAIVAGATLAPAATAQADDTGAPVYAERCPNGSQGVVTGGTVAGYPFQYYLCYS